LNELLLARLERQGTKSIDNMLKAIAESKKQEPWRLIFGLGILHVGANSSRKLLEHFGSIEKLAEASVEELAQCHDIGGIVAPSVHDWFRDPVNQALLQRLQTAGLTFVQRETVLASEKLVGTVWVITGALSQPREEIADIIRGNGGKVSGSVSAKTTYLLSGEESGSKLDKAKKLGVKVINEAEFRQMIA
jgi:DNA ligase (NAD+)